MARHPLALTPTLRAEARFPAAKPLAAAQASAAGAQKSVALQPVGAPRWHGQAVARWCRWGWWETDGSALNVTRII